MMIYVMTWFLICDFSSLPDLVTQHALLSRFMTQFRCKKVHTILLFLCEKKTFVLSIIRFTSWLNVLTTTTLSKSFTHSEELENFFPTLCISHLFYFRAENSHIKSVHEWDYWSELKVFFAEKNCFFFVVQPI